MHPKCTQEPVKKVCQPRIGRDCNQNRERGTDIDRAPPVARFATLLWCYGCRYSVHQAVAISIGRVTANEASRKHRHYRQMRLVLVVVGGFAATRGAGLRTRLHVVEAEAGRLRDIGVARSTALLLRDLVAIDVSGESSPHPAIPTMRIRPTPANLDLRRLMTASESPFYPSRSHVTREASAPIVDNVYIRDYCVGRALRRARTAFGAAPFEARRDAIFRCVGGPPATAFRARSPRPAAGHFATSCFADAQRGGYFAV